MQIRGEKEGHFPVTTDETGHDPLIGQALGHYRSNAKTGGSKDIVCKSEDAKPHRLVALKFPSEGIAVMLRPLAPSHQYINDEPRQGMPQQGCLPAAPTG